MWLAFLAGFVWVRIGAILQEETTASVDVGSGFQFGSPTVLGGYHMHHIASGVFFMAVAGWLAIHYKGPRVLRAIAILYGVGMGFVVDEIGYMIGGWGRTYGYHAEMFTVAVVVCGVMMSSVYFPGFWQRHFPHFWAGVWHRLARGYRRVRPVRSRLTADPRPRVEADFSPPQPVAVVDEVDAPP